MQPKVSILLPAYNAELYVERALNSLIKQTYTNLEINIIDDGSTDKTKEIIEEICKEDSRINFISRENKGLPVTLNELMAMSTGKYYARMDADDYSYPQRIEKQVEYMEQHPKIAVLGTSICLSTTKKKVLSNVGITPELRKIRMLFCNAGVPHPTAMLRADFFCENNIRYREDIVTSEDYRLWIDVILAGGEIDSLPDVLLEYRVSENQMTSRYSNEMKLLDLEIRKYYLEHWGTYSDEEKKLFLEWDTYSKRVDSVQYLALMYHMIKDYETQQTSETMTMYKECVFRWILKSIFQIKYSHDFKMLFSVFSLRVFHPSILYFVMREIKKVI